MFKAYNSAIAVATVLLQHDSSLAFTVDRYHDDSSSSYSSYFRLLIGKDNEHTVMINYSECLGYFEVWSDQIDSFDEHESYNDVRFNKDESDKMLTYIFNILEAYKAKA